MDLLLIPYSNLNIHIYETFIQKYANKKRH